jgi:hypothetical protein
VKRWQGGSQKLVENNLSGACGNAGLKDILDQGVDEVDQAQRVAISV